MVEFEKYGEETGQTVVTEQNRGFRKTFQSWKCKSCGHILENCLTNNSMRYDNEKTEKTEMNRHKEMHEMAEVFRRVLFPEPSAFPSHEDLLS